VTVDTGTLTPLELLTEQIGDVLKGYASALLWANAQCVAEDGESCEDGQSGDCEHTLNAHLEYSLEDFSDDDQRAMRRDVERMVLDGLTDFREYLERREYDPSEGTVAMYFGHDFALNRNGHGTGFWDRGLGELGERLAGRASAFGETYVYVGPGGISL
jgi:hypothetical protein